MSNFLQRLKHIGGALLLTGSLAWQSGAAQQGLEPPPGQQDQSNAREQSTIRVNVDLVNILFTVRAKHGGQLIPNLTQDAFKIYEDGKQQTIQRFSRETDLPVTLGLLIDISASQERLIDIERQAASAFFSSVIRDRKSVV